MKIIQIIPRFSMGGAEIMCENLTQALSEQGNQVIAVSLFDDRTPITSRLEQAGIYVVFLHKRPGFDFSLYQKLIRLFRDEKPDAVHSHLYVDKYVIPAAFFSGVPKVIHTLHSIAEKENTRSGKVLNHLFFRCHRVVPVALSDEIQKTVLDAYKLPSKKVPIIPNGVPLGRCIVKKDYKVHDSFALIHVGRMTAAKNHMNLLKGFQLFLEAGYNAQLTLIGDGECREAVSEEIQKLSLSESVHMVFQTDRVFPYLNQSDIFLLPSIYEGIPMSIIEAMGTGLPIIASAVGGIPDMLVNEHSGLLCEPTAESIYLCLKRFADDENLRASCGRTARLESAKFSAASMAEQYEEIYQLS